MFSYWLKTNQIFTLMCISECFSDEKEAGTLMAVLNLEAYNAIFPSFFLFSTCSALTQCFGITITVYRFICSIMKCSELCYWCSQAAAILFLQKVPTPVLVCRVCLQPKYPEAGVATSHWFWPDSMTASLPFLSLYFGKSQKSILSKPYLLKCQGKYFYAQQQSRGS